MTLNPPSTEAVSAFLYREAELLDGWRLDEWLELFSEDCVYWIPARLGADTDPTRHTSHVYDDRCRLEERVWRLTHGPAYRQTPRSEMSRVVSNTLLAEEDGITVARSRFVVAEYRNDRQRVFAGRVTHHLETGGAAGFIIKRKRVDLVDATAPMANLTMIL